MKVYRVEHAVDGLGPYQQAFDVCDDDDLARLALVETLNAVHSCSPDHPVLGVDIPEASVRDICAFESMESMSTWFEGFMELLLEYGYVIRCFEVASDCVRKGAKQVAFDPAGVERESVVSAF